MCRANQLVVEVHFVTALADELAERSRNLRTALLRGARRAIQQGDESEELPPQTTPAPHLEQVEK